jgi:hypothetical protein
METLLQDIHFGVRQLGRHRGSSVDLPANNSWHDAELL